MAGGDGHYNALGERQFEARPFLSTYSETSTSRTEENVTASSHGALHSTSIDNPSSSATSVSGTPGSVRMYHSSGSIGSDLADYDHLEDHRQSYSMQIIDSQLQEQKVTDQRKNQISDLQSSVENLRLNESLGLPAVSTPSSPSAYGTTAAVPDAKYRSNTIPNPTPQVELPPSRLNPLLASSIDVSRITHNMESNQRHVTRTSGIDAQNRGSMLDTRGGGANLENLSVIFEEGVEGNKTTAHLQDPVYNDLDRHRTTYLKMDTTLDKFPILVRRDSTSKGPSMQPRIDSAKVKGHESARGNRHVSVPSLSSVWPVPKTAAHEKRPSLHSDHKYSSLPITENVGALAIANPVVDSRGTYSPEKVPIGTKVSQQLQQASTPATSQSTTSVVSPPSPPHSTKDFERPLREASSSYSVSDRPSADHHSTATSAPPAPSSTSASTNHHVATSRDTYNWNFNPAAKAFGIGTLPNVHDNMMEHANYNGFLQFNQGSPPPAAQIYTGLPAGLRPLPIPTQSMHYIHPINQYRRQHMPVPSVIPAGAVDHQTQKSRQQYQHQKQLSVTHYDNFELEDMKGEIFSLCSDQHGCRFLQRKLEEHNASATALIFNETNEHVVSLMTDPFGNYLCQKLLEHCTAEQRTKIVEKVAPEIVPISLNMHGTRALQKMIESLSTKRQIDIVVNALKTHVVTLIKDLNGNHVVQKCVNCFEPANFQFIFDAVTAHCVEVATHRHGCCVLQRCIDHATESQRVQLVTEAISNALTIVQDPYANYVVQYVLELGDQRFREPLIRQFLGHISQLSMQKFSSNVIEKCIRVADAALRKTIIEELVPTAALEKLLRDSYANYVIQTALDFAEPVQREQLAQNIRPLLFAIRSTPYSRRILHKISSKQPQQNNYQGV